MEHRETEGPVYDFPCLIGLPVLLPFFTAEASSTAAAVQKSWCTLL